ncbi:4-hydroxy-tetrahydrodipicolinate synthase [Dehalobacterium formicoaceticum]|uniref:4-hydroxy-tetrahydrodipicolinate synthase n=1 Tax=Dehalobacterium formicoaceticum TaxID=51515 RepID=A0ABT1Y4V1_9FIRM|nr:4-hydroxy-tetrahydrodipicolinate synthase [Dehalobacterium formicoaceticum]MCR6545910.1 4-hydroxy-tetrahydrodipicolinate synthase [Dehalobacterium formicoaceticum]
MNFGSVITAMVTPFDQNGSVHFDQAQKFAQYLLENGSDSLVISGTTGESPTLNFEEKLTLFSRVKEGIAGKGAIIAGTGCNDTKETIQLSEAAAKVGVDGLLLVVPYYNKPTQEGLYQHFKAVAESVSIPIMLYNIPTRTGCNLLPRTVQRLAEIENIVAIKEAAGNMDQVSELRKLTGEDFAIYSGDDSATLPMLSLGGAGVVSVAAQLAGKQIKQMIELFKSGHSQKALEIHLQLFDLFKGIFVTTNPVPIKTALNMLGWNVGGFRLPLTEATAEEQGFIKQLLKQYKLLK